MSSAGQDLGCYITKNAAETKQRETGQDRLLAVIGKTARLEQRQVLSPSCRATRSFATTQVTCATVQEQASTQCTADALADQEVVYLDQAGTTKYRLGPRRDQRRPRHEGHATFSGGTQTQVGPNGS